MTSQNILCSSFYPYYKCEGAVLRLCFFAPRLWLHACAQARTPRHLTGASGNRVALTTAHTELDECMAKCADMETEGCCERTSVGCNFVAGDLAREKR